VTKICFHELQGEYGLAEAVGEIKEGKNQVKIRDRYVHIPYMSISD